MLFNLIKCDRGKIDIFYCYLNACKSSNEIADGIGEIFIRKFYQGIRYCETINELENKFSIV